MFKVREAITKRLMNYKNMATNNSEIIKKQANQALQGEHNALASLISNTLQDVIEYEGLDADVKWSFNDDFTGVVNTEKPALKPRIRKTRKQLSSEKLAAKLAEKKAVDAK